MNYQVLIKMKLCERKKKWILRIRSFNIFPLIRGKEDLKKTKRIKKLFQLIFYIYLHNSHLQLQICLRGWEKTIPIDLQLSIKTVLINYFLHLHSYQQVKFQFPQNIEGFQIFFRDKRNLFYVVSWRWHWHSTTLTLNVKYIKY